MFNQRTTLRNEEYDTYVLPQSEAPLKYILSEPRSASMTDYATRTFHILSDADVDRPVLTNRNDLIDYNTELTGRNPLRTRHIFGEESTFESYLRPISSGNGFLDTPVDKYRFNPVLLDTETPADNLGLARGMSSTRADLRNQFANTR